MGNEFAVFVKPWKQLTLPELGEHVRQLGFDLVELPVRPGFPCTPEQIKRDLPAAVPNAGRLWRARAQRCGGAAAGR